MNSRSDKVANGIREVNLFLGTFRQFADFLILPTISGRFIFCTVGFRSFFISHMVGTSKPRLSTTVIHFTGMIYYRATYIGDTIVHNTRTITIFRNNSYGLFTYLTSVSQSVPIIRRIVVHFYRSNRHVRTGTRMARLCYVTTRSSLILLILMLCNLFRLCVTCNRTKFCLTSLILKRGIDDHFPRANIQEYFLRMTTRIRQMGFLMSLSVEHLCKIRHMGLALLYIHPMQVGVNMCIISILFLHSIRRVRAMYGSYTPICLFFGPRHTLWTIGLPMTGMDIYGTTTIIEGRHDTRDRKLYGEGHNLIIMVYESLGLAIAGGVYVRLLCNFPRQFYAGQFRSTISGIVQSVIHQGLGPPVRQTTSTVSTRRLPIFMTKEPYTSSAPLWGLFHISTNCQMLWNRIVHSIFLTTSDTLRHVQGYSGTMIFHQGRVFVIWGEFRGIRRLNVVFAI